MSYPITSFSKGDAANIVLIISIAIFIIYIIIQTTALVFVNSGETYDSYLLGAAAAASPSLTCPLDQAMMDCWIACEEFFSIL